MIDIIGARKYAITVSIKEHSFEREQLLSRSIKVVHFVVRYLRITMVQRHVLSVIFLALVSFNVCTYYIFDINILCKIFCILYNYCTGDTSRSDTTRMVPT